MTITTVVLVCLAVYRGTLLVTSDRVTRTPRRWLRAWLGRHWRRGHYAERDMPYVLDCAWCISLWLGVVGATVAYVWPTGWWRWPALALTASAVAGLLATIAAPDDNDPED